MRRRILSAGVGEIHGAKEVTDFAASHQTIFGKLIKNSQRSSMKRPAEGHGRRKFKNGRYVEAMTIVISLGSLSTKILDDLANVLAFLAATI